jgi:hypothetical protein
VLCVFPVAFAALWTGVFILISLISGWSRLAKNFATDRNSLGREFHWQSGSVGFVRYRNCLNVAVASNGLFLWLPWIFRVGHRKLFIPWSAIHDEESKQVLWFSMIRFQVGKPGIARIRLPRKVFEARPGGMSKPGR